MRIGTLAKAVGCTVETIRFYEKQGLLPQAERAANNFRIYNAEHLQRLSFICYCRTLDISLSEIKMLLNLSRSSEAQAKEIDTLLDQHIKDVAKRIHELDHLRMELVKLKRQCGKLTGVNIMETLLSSNKVRFRKVS
ncbi:Cd(II)/Pb(II)-responsive transcriptional regulator [Pasteurellaceae bacterium LIM206]|nr:Cd(II)/Pb(II)-responsive transcriptional regulator [Pasteurellaceae bacterium LIM206]